MAGKFTVSGTDTTITFTYTAPTAQIQAIVNDAAQYYWNIGMGNHGTQEEPKQFTDLLIYGYSELIGRQVNVTVNNHPGRRLGAGNVFTN